MDDLMAQFAQMQKYTAALHGLMTAAQEHAPRHAEGTDGSGLVRVELGPDGLPVSIRVAAEWTRRITAEGFAGAVVEAAQAAMSERMREWTQALAQDGWRDRADRMRGPSAATGGQVPAAFRKPAPQVDPRPIGDVAEDMFKAFDRVGSAASAPAATGASGSDESGKLTITLSPTGMTGCTADPRWVAEQSAARLMNALDGALRSAKAALAGAAAAPTQDSGLDGLLAEAMALLNDPRKLAD
ncbi:hypothetical protein [Actinokineospora bangkokensis]|uniref:hypothetical protein n=1 Tax=Actinokineospora bangkokensis TaxID=1193682 RepID=UPI000ABF0CAD|nr:hypothetical protein [Actinokineospora bangkokensis]